MHQYSCEHRLTWMRNVVYTGTHIAFKYTFLKCWLKTVTVVHICHPRCLQTQVIWAWHLLKYLSASCFMPFFPRQLLERSAVPPFSGINKLPFILFVSGGWMDGFSLQDDAFLGGDFSPKPRLPHRQSFRYSYQFPRPLPSLRSSVSMLCFNPTPACHCESV